jgi:hypothetical protein
LKLFLVELLEIQGSGKKIQFILSANEEEGIELCVFGREAIASEQGEEVEKMDITYTIFAVYFFLFRESSAKKILHSCYIGTDTLFLSPKKTSVFFCFCNKFNAEHKALSFFLLFLLVLALLLFNGKFIFMTFCEKI